MNLRTLSRTGLDSCLDKIATGVSQGLTPNEAIIESVKSADLHPSGIQILVQAYNTAAINQQRLAGDDIHTKTAAVPLADADEIRETLFPTPHVPMQGSSMGEPADLRKIASFQPSRRSSQEISAGLQLLRSEPTTKVAAAAPAAPVDGYFTKRAKAIDEELKLNGVVHKAGIKCAAAIEDLKHYLQQHDAPAVVELSPRIKVAIGEKAVATLMAIASPMRTLKLASKCRDFTHGVHLVREVTRYLDEYAVAKQAAAQVVVPPPVVPTHVTHHTDDILFGDNTSLAADGLKKVDPGVEMTGESLIRKVAAGPFTTAAVLETMRHLSRAMTAGLTNDPVEKNLSTLSDPLHERELQRIRSQATLVDLMNNDEVIAEHDPDEVIGAYNQLLELSPRMGERRILAQNALRSRLAAGTLDPFASSQLVDLGNKLTPQPPRIEHKPPTPQGPKL